MRHIVAVSVLFASLAVVTTTARGDVTSAARAFAEGQSALVAEDYDRAAQSFELADSMVPSKEALRSAVRARYLGGQLQRAATLAAALIARYPGDAESVALANDILPAAQLKFSRVVVACSATCAVAVDKRAISLGPARVHDFFITPGRQSLEVSFANDQIVRRVVTLKVGERLRLEIAPPSAAADPARPTAQDHPAPGLPPEVMAAGAIVTLGLAGVATWSSFNTRQARDAYLANPQHPHDLWVDGHSRQTRTNLLWGGTAAAGVATVAIAVFWTRWHDHPATETRSFAIVPVGPGGLVLGLSGTL